MKMRLAAVRAEDFDDMLALRIAAMRPSLEAIGRFDPDRARERFQSQFLPSAMRWIEHDGARVGLLTVHRQDDPWYVQHLYLAPGSQGRGIGAQVLGELQEQARAAGVAIELEALNGSPAQRFYERQGFRVKDVAELDTRFRWESGP